MEATIQTGWSARLALRFARRGQGTVLVDRVHEGPLAVQRAFYPPEDAGACHVYVLHPPGGLVGGDLLSIEVEAERDARALLTTPAATKLYRTAHGVRPCAQRLRLRAAAGAAVEWLPQETIVYDGARAILETRVELDGGASFVGWEVLCLGRPAAQERFERGSVRQRFEIWRDGVPRCLERMALPAGGPIAAARFGLAGEPVTATLLASPAPGPEGLARLRALCGGVTDGALACVTIIDDVAICRYLGGSAAEARALFVDAWAVLRPGLSGRAACSPRIWAT